MESQFDKSTDKDEAFTGVQAGHEKPEEYKIEGEGETHCHNTEYHDHQF